MFARVRPKDACPLSPRQYEILNRLRTGATMPELAAELQVGVETVKTHCAGLRCRLGARSITHAVAIMEDNGWFRTSLSGKPRP